MRAGWWQMDGDKGSTDLSWYWIECGGKGWGVINVICHVKAHTIKDMKPLKDFKQKCDLIRLLKTGNYWKSLLKTWCSLGQRQWQFGNFFSETKMSNSITLSLDFLTSSLSIFGIEWFFVGWGWRGGVGNRPCIVECTATSLACPHQMLVASLINCDNQEYLQTITSGWESPSGKWPQYSSQNADQSLNIEIFISEQQ